jgi:hypothetical protein
MTASPGAGDTAGQRVLARLLADPTGLDRSELTVLVSLGEDALDGALRAFAAEHGVAALPALTTLAEARPSGVSVARPSGRSIAWPSGA